VTTGEIILIAAIVLVPAILLWALFLWRANRATKPELVLGIPHSMRPGQPDEVLEGPRIERLQLGGLLTVLVLVGFMVAYWLPEAERQESFTERFSEESIERGKLIFSVAPILEEDADPQEFKAQEKALALGQGCANCHGGINEDDPSLSAAGGFASPKFEDPVTGKTINNYAAPPLQTVFQRWDEEVIRFTIERGRPGTPMPAWGVDYGGSMTTQMVDDVMAWLQTLPGNQTGPEISEDCQKPTGSTMMSCGQEIFEARCAVCHGPQGQGKDESGESEETAWFQGMALWKGKVKHLTKAQHITTVTNGRRFAFMPPHGEAPSQGIPIPPYPLTEEQIEAVVTYERSL
jgi:mono/diheme cytochrome c family protein